MKEGEHVELINVAGDGSIWKSSADAIWSSLRWAQASLL